MNHKIRIIKRADRKERELDRVEPPNRQPTREITTTIKLWVSEFKQRKCIDEDLTRIGNKLMNNAESVG
jgi:hypothetical protein